MTQSTLNLYPTVPGSKRSAPSTSAAAAQAMREPAVTLRDRVEYVLRYAWNDGGMTADETAERLGEGVLSIRPRLSELRAMNKIEDSGLRRRNASGCNAVVWRVKG